MADTLRNIIYQSIRDDITYGRLSPGERILENQLAEQFKASRSPIREALRQLEAEGLITFDTRKGISISKLSVKEVEEIYNLRCLLESHAARITAEKVTEEQLGYLKDLHSKLKRAAANSDLKSWIQNNILFHDFFSENCENSNLHRILTSLKRRVYLYHYIIINIPGNFKAYIDHHQEILRACEKKDGRLAEKYMKIHIDKVKNILVGYLNKFPAF
jgi:DNA-binding GntR family transcriptional regulator